MTTLDKNPYAAHAPPAAAGGDENFDYDYYDPHCFFSSGLAQNRRRLGFIATCSSVQCKTGGSEGYDPLLPFKEDLAEWLYKMIRADINPDKFFQELQSGVYLCKLGIHMQKSSVKFNKEHPEDKSAVPKGPPRLKYANATQKSPPFYCRDNISNFLSWSIEFGVKQSCRFETDDLTMRKNDRQIVIHLMEVGRMGVKFGIEPPTLIKLEMALEEEPPTPIKFTGSLDEQVQALAAECNCSVPFKVVRVSEGKYKVGEGRSIVFVRVLRSHVMVRVGGGWETLQAYFSKMDPCRDPVGSFGGRGGPSAQRAKQRFESQASVEEPGPMSPPPKPVREEAPPPAPVALPEPEMVEEDVEMDAPPVIQQEQVKVVENAAPVAPAKPKRPTTSRRPAPAPVQSTPAPAPKQRKAPVAVAKSAPAPARTLSPSKAPTRAASPAGKAPVGVRASTPAKAPARASSPSHQPPPTQPQYAYVRDADPIATRTPSPSAIKTSGAGSTGAGKAKATKSASTSMDGLPPWRNVGVNLASPARPPPLGRAFSTPAPLPMRPKTTPAKKAPPAPKPQTFKFSRGTQSKRRPKITSPELIRRAMQIMGDDGNQEQEDAVSTPSDEAIEAAKAEMRGESGQYDEDESVTVEMDMITPSDSGLGGTVQPEKPAPVAVDDVVVEDIELEESAPAVSGYDTLQDISDMVTDDKSLAEELDRYDDLPHDETTEEEIAPLESQPEISPQTSQRMDEYLQAQQELEDTINSFQREYSTDDTLPAPAEFAEPILEAVVEPEMEEISDEAEQVINELNAFEKAAYEEAELEEAVAELEETTEEVEEEYVEGDMSEDEEAGEENEVEVDAGAEAQEEEPQVEEVDDVDGPQIEIEIMEGTIQDVRSRINEGVDDKEWGDSGDEALKELKTVEADVLPDEVDEVVTEAEEEEDEGEDGEDIEEDQVDDDEDEKDVEIESDDGNWRKEKMWLENRRSMVASDSEGEDEDIKEGTAKAVEADEPFEIVGSVEDVKQVEAEAVTVEADVEPSEQVGSKTVELHIVEDFPAPPEDMVAVEDEAMYDEEELPPPMEMEDLEVIQEDVELDLQVSTETVKEVQAAAPEPVVMKPNKAPLPNNSSLNITKPRYPSEPSDEEGVVKKSTMLARNQAFVEELKSMKGQPRRLQQSSGHLSDSDRSTASEKGVSDSSSGYHEDYETSDGEPLDTTIPDVIMEVDDSTRSILKGSVKEPTPVSREPAPRAPSVSSVHSSIPARIENDIDEESVFSIDEEARAKGMNLPSEGHVREAVFTKAIEAAIHPLAPPSYAMPFMGGLQSASIVLPSKKAIKKASAGEYNYDGRRDNLERVISNQHTEKKDMQWDGDEAVVGTDGQTRDEQVSKWSGTLRSSQKKKKGGAKKKDGGPDALSEIERQVNAMRANCPVHSKDPHAPMPSAHQHAQHAPPRKATKPVARTASMPTRAQPKVAARTPAPRTTPPPRVNASVAPKARSAVARSVSNPVRSSIPARGSKAIAVKPASHVSTPREVMGTSPGSMAHGPLTPNLDNMNKLPSAKAVPVKRISSLKGTGRKTPLKSSTLPRDNLRSGPKCRDLP